LLIRDDIDHPLLDGPRAIEFMLMEVREANDACLHRVEEVCHSRVVVNGCARPGWTTQKYARSIP
jgi:hypothetical protein